MESFPDYSDYLWEGLWEGVKLFFILSRDYDILNAEEEIRKMIDKEVLNMLTLQGYYDGENVRILERIQAKKNQKVMITVLDEFVEEKPVKREHSARGILSEYANPKLWDEEKKAWEKAVAKKYGDA